MIYKPVVMLTLSGLLVWQRLGINYMMNFIFSLTRNATCELYEHDHIVKLKSLQNASSVDRWNIGMESGRVVSAEQGQWKNAVICSLYCSAL